MRRKFGRCLGPLLKAQILATRRPTTVLKAASQGRLREDPRSRRRVLTREPPPKIDAKQRRTSLAKRASQPLLAPLAAWTYAIAPIRRSVIAVANVSTIRVQVTVLTSEAVRLRAFPLWTIAGRGAGTEPHSTFSYQNPARSDASIANHHPCRSDEETVATQFIGC